MHRAHTHSAHSSSACARTVFTASSSKSVGYANRHHVLDTETTGLPTRWGAKHTELDVQACAECFFQFIEISAGATSATRIL